MAHISMAHPVCGRLGNLVQKAATDCSIDAEHGGTYLVMEGPQFSTLAESELYRSWKCDVIGMTNMPEAKLAREAEICYTSVAMVTDYDCWHPNHDDVTVNQIISVLNANAEKARLLIKNVAPLVFSNLAAKDCACHFALDSALITSENYRDPEILSSLEAITRRVLGGKK